MQPILILINDRKGIGLPHIGDGFRDSLCRHDTGYHLLAGGIPVDFRGWDAIFKSHGIVCNRILRRLGAIHILVLDCQRIEQLVVKDINRGVLLWHDTGDNRAVWEIPRDFRGWDVEFRAGLKGIGDRFRRWGVVCVEIVDSEVAGVCSIPETSNRKSIPATKPE